MELSGEQALSAIKRLSIVASAVFTVTDVSGEKETNGSNSAVFSRCIFAKC